jgi:arginyl-tRNA--protein-N-Asp/Glu arginylyltransferase
MAYKQQFRPHELLVDGQWRVATADDAEGDGGGSDGSAG